MSLAGRRVAVAGMGRSGIAVAEAAVRRGATVSLLDEKSAETPDALDTVERLSGLGVEVLTGWHGRLSPEDCDLFVPSPGFRRTHPALLDATSHGIPVWSEVEFAFRIAQAPIVAITGTNGKSTTTVMTWLALRAAGVEAHLCGNISGSGFPERTLTEAAEVAAWDEVLVAEISSFQLEWVEEFRPKVASILNVTPDHLDRHPSFEDYRATKLRLIARMTPADVVIWNSEEPSVPRELLQTAARVVAVPDPQTVWSTDHALGIGSVEGALKDFQVVGSHQRSNAMVALAMAQAILRSEDREVHVRMIAAVQQMPGLDHRMRLLGSKNGVQFVNNSMCTNPGAVLASAKAIPGRKVLLMGGLMKGLDFGSVREFLAGSPDRVVFFSDHADALAEAVGRASDPKFSSLDEAFSHAAKLAEPGDTVMLAPGCASAEPYANFRERGEAFEAMVRGWLA